MFLLAASPGIGGVDEPNLALTDRLDGPVVAVQEGRERR